ncbi:hypothetical protein EJB05_54711, partial [Eragrostis curvula]
MAGDQGVRRLSNSLRVPLCDRTNIEVAALGQEDALIAKKLAQCTEQRKFPAVPWKRKSGSPDDAPANTRKQGSWNSCVHYMISFHDNDAMHHNAIWKMEIRST